MKLVKIFIVERPNRAPDEQRWEWIDGMHCPSCGKQSVWHPETDPGDYYVGETHICVDCAHRFTIQVQGGDDWYDPILARLRS